MKKILLALLMSACAATSASAALTVTLIPNVIANAPASQAGFNLYNQNVNVPAGTWLRSQYNLSIKANDGMPVPIKELTSLTLNITSTPNPIGQMYTGAGQVFNTEGVPGAGPIYNAYDAMGNNITASVLGQSILGNDFTAEGIYEIRITSVDVPGLPGSEPYAVNNPGDVMTATFSAELISGNEASQSSAVATTTIVPVPEPSISTTLLALSYLGLMIRSRKA